MMLLFYLVYRNRRQPAPVIEFGAPVPPRWQ